jgi:hypothetical protein
MTHVIEAKSKRRLLATLAAGLAFSALLSVGTFVASAMADEFQTDIHSWHRNDELGNGRWGGIHYVAPPPVAYNVPYTGTPSKYPPLVPYVPGFGISLRGGNIGIQ